MLSTETTHDPLYPSSSSTDLETTLAAATGAVSDSSSEAGEEMSDRDEWSSPSYIGSPLPPTEPQRQSTGAANTAQPPVQEPVRARSAADANSPADGPPRVPEPSARF